MVICNLVVGQAEEDVLNKLAIIVIKFENFKSIISNGSQHFLEKNRTTVKGEFLKGIKSQNDQVYDESWILVTR